VPSDDIPSFREHGTDGDRDRENRDHREEQRCDKRNPVAARCAQEIAGDMIRLHRPPRRVERNRGEKRQREVRGQPCIRGRRGYQCSSRPFAFSSAT